MRTVSEPWSQELDPWLEEAREWTEANLIDWLGVGEGWPSGLFTATSYALLGGGKRLRPILVRLFSELCGGVAADALAPALAIEMIHTYSLVHDDLPCMDDDDLRRGRPTCHKAYGEAMAVLVGDTLLTEAFGVLASSSKNGVEWASILANASGARGMVGGQVLDMTSTGSASSADQVRAVHLAKTAALIGAACEMGAIAGGADKNRREAAHAYGIALGLGFQAQDDVLDVIGDAQTLGKTPGKDEALDRATSVAALGLQGARDEAEARAEEAREQARGMGFEEGDLPFQLIERLLKRDH
ncbi:MAG: geranylgeranyl pyrophosphate synthase [Planctomycetota bacterium]|jgi:geranylgeranyl pyrophosphate synthase